MRWIPAESGARYRIEDSAFTRTDRSRLHRCRDEAGTPYVYKAYGEPPDTEDEAARLIELARLGRTVDPAQPGYDAIGWMVDVVLQERAAVGVVLRAAPTGFFNLGRDPRTFDRLHNPASYPPDAAVRISVLLSICEQFACLEREGLVHGRISARKLLWRPDPAPRAHLLGCDRLRRAQTATPPDAAVTVPAQWRDPRLALGAIPAPDLYSDRLALAGLVYRGLLLTTFAPGLDERGALATTYSLPPVLDSGIRTLFDRAFSDLEASDSRPRPTEWHDALSALAAADIDRLTIAELESGTEAAEAQAAFHAPAPPPAGPLNRTPSPTPPRAEAQFDIMPPADDETPGSGAPDAFGPPYQPAPAAGASQRRVLLAVLGLAAIATVLVVTVVLTSRPSSPPADAYQDSGNYPFQSATTYTADPGAGGALTSDQATDAQATDQTSDQAADAASPSDSPTTPDAATALQQAQAVFDLVNSSSSDRSLVAQAIQNEVSTCANVGQGLTDLQTAAADRQRQQQSAQQLDVSALGNGQQLQTDLVSAFQFSYKADESYAAWAQDVLDSGCSGNAQPDESFTSGDAYSKEADTAKDAFLHDWQPVATQFGLPVPSQGSF